MRFYPTGGGGGADGSAECTATRYDLLKGTTAILSDSDDAPVEGLLELTGNAGVGDVLSGATFYSTNAKEKQTGTLALTGNAQAAHVLSGETYYDTDAKQKRTGTMTVNSLLSFSVAAYSGRRVLAKWQNPYAATGKPFGGVVIKASTGTYPAWDASTWAAIYTGAGNNTAPGEWSQVYMDLPALNTTYYFTALSYVNVNISEYGGVLYSPVFDSSSVKHATCSTGGQISKTFTSSQTYTIPAGYTLMDAFLVGGGASGQRASGGYNAYKYGGIGGSGGRTTTQKNISVTSNESLSFIIGSGGAGIPGIRQSGNDDDYPRNQNCTNNGGETYISRGSTKLASAAGGTAETGGSGGGGKGDVISAGSEGEYNPLPGGNGGSNGANGATVYGDYGTNVGSTGQGTTTRAFGESSGTIYAGGGGGGGETGSRVAPSTGGTGQNGGGNGGTGYGFGSSGTSGTNATANTGSGGGGCGGASPSNGRYGNQGDSGAGGSGIIMIRLH